LSDILVPHSPRDLGLIPETWLDGQRETVEAVLAAFLSGKKYVMLSAPTGSGKSLVAAAVQKLLARAGGGSGGQSVALTQTIQLQKQYAETLPDAAIITGRNNHSCDLPDDHPARLGQKELSAEDAPCAAGEGCPIGMNVRGGCAYYSQFWNAADSPMVTMNYAYASRVLQQDWFSTGEKDEEMGKGRVVENPFRRSLLVVDECHLAERAIVESAGVNLPTKLLEDYNINLPNLYTRTRVVEGRSVREYETAGVWVAWAVEAVKIIGVAATKQRERIGLLTAQGHLTLLPAEKLKYKRLTTLQQSLDMLQRIEPLRYDEWSVTRSQYKYGPINVRPLWGWTVARSKMWRWFDKVLLMSATPGDPEIERIKLGIPKEEFVFVERPSRFPVANRPVFFWPIAKMNYASTEDDWMQIARAIRQIAESGQWAHRKGLVHTGSKANAERLTRMLNADSALFEERYVTHGAGKGEANAALEAYKRNPDPVVLVTASFTTGLDLPYLIGWQVIAKVPFGSLGDEVTARRRAFKAADGVPFGQKVYQSEAMNTVVQAAGRIVRTKDDTGSTFILDGNYALLHKMAWKPAFYTEAYRELTVV
jgi:Rad3-related DNA helicase